VCVVDFVENYSFEIQNEVQSMHWPNYQISILVHISFHHNLAPNPYDENLRILIEYHFYILDNRKHNSKFVQYYFKLHLQYMVEQEYHLNGIGYGMMDVHPSLRVTSHGTLCLAIEI